MVDVKPKLIRSPRIWIYFYVQMAIEEWIYFSEVIGYRRIR